MAEHIEREPIRVPANIEQTDVELRADFDHVQFWIGRHGAYFTPAQARQIAESFLLGAQMVERGLVGNAARLDVFMAKRGARQGAR